MRVHNKVESKALIKEAVQNGSIYDLDNVSVVTHSGKHVADILIEKQGAIVLRSYPIKGETLFEQVGSVND